MKSLRRSTLQALTFMRKEVADALRQPRLLLTLVLGPFLIMAAFGLGYRDEPRRMKTVFVVADGNPLKGQLDKYTKDIEQFVEVVGTTSDDAEARRQLRDGDVDVVVEFPETPLDDIGGGEQSKITVVHTRLDPVERTAITDDEVQPYLGFKEGNYSRHRVMKNEFVEMLVLCWKPGQRTPIHDHNGSHGVVRVQQGLMSETIFAYDVDKGLCHDTDRECPTGTVTGADLPDIHRLGNPDDSGQDLITVHIYAPPLGVLKTYKVGSSQVDLYTPNDFPT